MEAHMMIKRVVVFGVVWLVSAVVTVGVLTVAVGVSEVDASLPDPPGVRADGTVDESKLPDIVPVGGPGGQRLGWTYETWGPDSFPAELLPDPAHSRRIFDDQGGETLVIEDGPTGSVGGVFDHPIFSTREEAERYRDTLLASGSGGAPVNVND